MCGIVAIFAYDPHAESVDRNELARINNKMAARGPDGEGIWISENQRVGLAHRRLSIIDTSPAGAQPMCSLSGELRISFNGEIYNYRELRAALSQEGVEFATNSDTEVLLCLYEKYGRQMLHRLRGMFAFAIWDQRDQSIFLARDPFGIKPLYISDDGSSLRVASQVKALLTSRKIDKRPSAPGQVGYYLWGYVPEPHTLFQGIRALSAGTWLHIKQGGKKHEGRYFDVVEECRKAESTTPADATSKKMNLREALVDSVRSHLVADVPVGLFLSSGLDSTCLAAIATEVSDAPLKTVTLGFNEFRGQEQDEVPLAEVAASKIGTNHQTCWVSTDDFRGDFDAVIAAMDQPSIDGINTFFVSKVTAQTGLKVAISGLGGDELFGGYPSFQQIPRLVAALKPFRGNTSLGRIFRVASAPIIRKFTSPKYASLLEYGPKFGGAYFLRRGLFMPWELNDFLDPEFVRKGCEELNDDEHLQQTIERIKTPRLKIFLLETTFYLRNQLLRDADWAGMAHGLEIRVPLVDVELFRNLVAEIASSDPPDKSRMANTPICGLPPDILKRRKTGFTVPINRWVHEFTGKPSKRHGYREWAKLVRQRYSDTLES